MSKVERDAERIASAFATVRAKEREACAHEDAGWQSIETAPETGTFIGCDPGKMLPTECIRYGSSIMPLWAKHQLVRTGSAGYRSPTLWQPLPAPPSAPCDGESE